jgi:integrase/recombinase XerD
MQLNQYLHNRFARRTAHGYELMIDHYREAVKHPEQAKYKDVLNYLEKERSKGKKVRTLHAHLSAIKSYYDWMKETGIRTDHPCKHLKLKDRIDPRVNVQDLFSSAELSLLMEQEHKPRIHELPGIKLRNKVILSLLIWQGLATKNIINLEVKDFNLEQATVYIRSGTLLNARTLELHPKQILLINRYLTEERPVLNKNNLKQFIIMRSGQPETGCGIRSLIDHSKHLFPNKNLSALTIRKSVIANLLKTGKDIRAVQVFAGHKSPMTTELYQQSGIEELTAAVLKFHPLK